ncbi:outer membrane lipoprotein SlyB [Oxalobacteraceae bacterium GrIS 2.11]
MKNVLLLTTLAGVLALTGCAVAPHSANVYQGPQTMGEQSVRMGVVESIRNVVIDNGQSGVGVLGGAALGGLAGNTIGKGNGSVAGAIGGAIAGGLIGQQVEKSVNNKPGLEITVKLDNGNLTAITQDADEQFNVGDRVRLLSNGRTTRVTH